ncbi:MAG: hypothetical protein WAN93_08540 [Solirubrobacteraceae bacterium]
MYLDSEEAHKLAAKVLDPLAPEQCESFSGVVEGRLSPSQVKHLSDAGLVVELLDTGEPATGVPEATGGPEQTLAQSGGLIEDIKREASTVSFDEDQNGLVLGTDSVSDHDPRLHHFADYQATPTFDQALAEDVYNIDIRDPITREQRLELDKLGVDIAAFEPGVGYRAFLTREQYAKVSELPYVARVTRYSFEQAVTPELLEVVSESGASEQPELMSGEEQAESPPQIFDCLVHREEDLAKIRALIDQSPDTTIVGASNLRVRFSADVHIPFIAALAGLPEVRKLSPYEAPKL